MSMAACLPTPCSSPHSLGPGVKGSLEDALATSLSIIDPVGLSGLSSQSQADGDEADGEEALGDHDES